MLLQAMRFFVVIGVLPRPLLAGIAAVAAGGSLGLAAGMAAGPDLLPPLVLLQLFAASSGFRVPAGRGHFDLLLTGGASRLTIAAAHLVVSSAPGVLAWLLLAVVERAAGGRALTTAAALAGVVAVPGLAWAISVWLPRLSAAILLLFVWVGAGVPQAWPSQVVWPALAMAAAVVAVALWRAATLDIPLEHGQ